MMGRTHATSGAVLALATMPLLRKYGLSADPWSSVTYTIAAAGGAMLPDFDHRKATIAQTFGPITKGLAVVVEKLSGGHRNGTHSILGIIAFTALAYGINNAVVILNYFHVENAALISRIIMGVWITFLLAVISATFHLEASDIGFVHLMVCAVGGLVIVGVSIIHTFPFDVLPWAVAVGVTAHILGDMLTKQGCPLIWPIIGTRFKVANFTTDQFFERQILWRFLVAMTVVLLLWNIGALDYVIKTVGPFLASLNR